MNPIPPARPKVPIHVIQDDGEVYYVANHTSNILLADVRGK